MQRYIDRTVSLPYLRKTVEYIPTEMYVGDYASHTWRIKIINPHGEPVDVSGASVTAYSVRSDGATVISEGSVSGTDTVLITFAEACYHVPGQLRNLVRIETAGSSMVLDSFYTTVNESESGTIVDPGETIISLESILEELSYKEDVGYLTIGDDSYQLRVSTTDAGEEGYVTFVLEAPQA